MRLTRRGQVLAQALTGLAIVAAMIGAVMLAELLSVLLTGAI